MPLKIVYIGEEKLLKLYNQVIGPDSGYEIVSIPEASTEEDIIKAGKDAAVLLVDPMARVTEKAMESLPKLKLIQSVAVGFQGIDADAAKKRGIPVCNCRAVNASAVAEQAILLMLGLLRDIRNGDREVREGHQIEVKYRTMSEQTLHELGECTVGIIGFGAIGRKTAALAKAFGARVLATDVYDLSKEEQEELGIIWCGRDQLLAESDIVSLHMPLFDSTYHVADAAFFAKMKRGAYLVNTARGGLVDNDALLDAIRTGRLAGAGLDVIEDEPVLADNPVLLAEPEVESRLLLSCHVGGLSAGSFKRASAMIAENLRRVESGEEVINRVNG